MNTAWHDRDVSRPATTLACSLEAVWLWPGIPLTRRRGAVILPRSPDTSHRLVAKLHGPEAVHSGVTGAIERAASHLNAGDIARAERSLTGAGLPPVTPDGQRLMWAVAARLGLAMPCLPVGQSPRLWSQADIELFARLHAAQAVETWIGIAKAGFNPDELRDGRGRWSTGGEGGSPVAVGARPVSFRPDKVPGGAAPAVLANAAAAPTAIPWVGDAAAAAGRALWSMGADLATGAGEIVSAPLIAVAAAVNLAIVSPTAGQSGGTVAGRPDIHVVWNDESGTLDLYGTQPDGKVRRIAEGRFGSDGTYRDAAGTVIACFVDGRPAIEAAILPAPPSNSLSPVEIPPLPADPPVQLPPHTGYPAETPPPAIVTNQVKPEAPKPQIESYPASPPRFPNAVNAKPNDGSKPAKTGRDGKRRVRNQHLAGGVHPETGIPFDKDGYPDFSGVTEIEVTIVPTGSRRADARAANKAAGIAKTPKGFVWHHHQDGTTMQLVPKDLHRKTGHTGGYERKGGR